MADARRRAGGSFEPVQIYEDTAERIHRILHAINTSRSQARRTFPQRRNMNAFFRRGLSLTQDEFLGRDISAERPKR